MVGALDANLSLERLLIYPAGHEMPQTCLGPTESPCI